MKEEITKAYEALPVIVQDVIDNSNWEDQLSIILKKNNLRIDQISVVENNTIFVMFVLMSVEDFITSLKEDAGINNKDTVDAIMVDIEKTIFAKIREALIKSTAETKDSHVQISSKSPGIESREDLLKEIEDPVAIPDIRPSTVKAVVPTSVIPDGSTTANVAAPVASVPETPRPMAPKIDPYREPIE